MKKLFALFLALALLLPCFGAYAADAPPLLRGQEVLELYSFDYQNRAYHRVAGADDVAFLTKTLAVLPVSKGTEKTVVSDGARGFLAFLKDGTRLAWYVTSAQLSDDIGVIPATQNVRDRLMNLSGRYNARYPGSAQRLAYINPSKIKWVEYYNMNYEQPYSAFFAGRDPVAIKAIMTCLKSLEMKPAPSITRYPPGEDVFRPDIGYGFMAYIYTDTGRMYACVPEPGTLEIQGAIEDIRYQLARPEQFEAMRKLISEQCQTFVEAERSLLQTKDNIRWSTADADQFKTFKHLLSQQNGKSYTATDMNGGILKSLRGSLAEWDLTYYHPKAPVGSSQTEPAILFLPEGDGGKGFYWSTEKASGWYLTEQATKELKTLMQPMTKL